MIIIFMLVFCVCHGFLLDGKTIPPPTPGSVMTDEHYKFVMQFIFQERQSRLQLEEQMKQLQQQLYSTQTDLVNKMNALDHCSMAESNRVSGLLNRTNFLEDKVSALTKTSNAITLQNSQLQHENVQLRNDTKQLENDMSNLKKLQRVVDLQTMANLQNRTNHLEQEIQGTNSRQTLVISEANARKQDFIALFQKLQTMEHDVGKTLDTLNNKTYETAVNLNNTAVLLVTTTGSLNSSIQHKLTAMSRATENRLHSLESNFQSTSANVQKKLDAISNRALFTASPIGTTISSGGVMPFRYVETRHGINSLSSLTNSGIFTVEKEGYYLISCFVNTNTPNADFDIMHNSNRIASATKHGDSSYETHAATITAHLNVGDTVKVTARVTMYVDSAPDSMFSVVQII